MAIFYFLEQQDNNPLHEVKLKEILEHLVATYGWAELSKMIDIRCFKIDPSIKSSLTFLRKTPWARERVKKIYLKSPRQKGLSFDLFMH